MRETEGTWRGVLLVVGVVVLVLSLSYLALGWAARLLDWRMVSEDASAPCLQPEVAVTMPRRRMSKHDSEVVTVVLSSTATSTCAVDISISAPGFEIDPPMSVVPVTLSLDAPAEVNWILSPVRMGTHRVLIRAGESYRAIGVVVTNVLGLTDRQAQWVSAIGTFFGPSLTVPWLYETWQQRKRDAERRAQAARINELEQQVAALREEQARRRDRKRWWEFWR